MNNLKSKKIANHIAYSYLEMASTSGVISDFSKNDKEYSKIQTELDIIKDRCFERAENFNK